MCGRGLRDTARPALTAAVSGRRVVTGSGWGPQDDAAGRQAADRNREWREKRRRAGGDGGGGRSEERRGGEKSKDGGAGRGGGEDFGEGGGGGRDRGGDTEDKRLEAAQRAEQQVEDGPRARARTHTQGRPFRGGAACRASGGGGGE
jgi:protein Tex